MADQDDIRSLLESAVAGETQPPQIADPPELADVAPPDVKEDAPAIDGRARDELGRFAPKAEEKPDAAKEARSRRA